MDCGATPLVLAALIGWHTVCAPWSGSSGLVWEQETRSFFSPSEGQVQQHQTPENSLRLYFAQEMVQHRFRARSSVSATSPWSEWSRWYPVVPLADLDGDDVVGSRDYLVFRHLFGLELLWNLNNETGVYIDPSLPTGGTP